MCPVQCVTYVSGRATSIYAAILTFAFLWSFPYGLLVNDLSTLRAEFESRFRAR
jgi:hypothetical protein